VQFPKQLGGSSAFGPPNVTDPCSTAERRLSPLLLDVHGL